MGIAPLPCSMDTTFSWEQFLQEDAIVQLEKPDDCISVEHVSRFLIHGFLSDEKVQLPSHGFIRERRKMTQRQSNQ